MSSVADNVRKAADHIERYGLHKGEYAARADFGAKNYFETIRDQGLPCCTMAAFSAYGVPGTTENGFRDFLEKEVGTPYIGDWNDAPERTQGDVVDALRRYADHLEQKEQA